jgi:formylglycine-generating enzyme required for sulfatase activity
MAMSIRPQAPLVTEPQKRLTTSPANLVWIAGGEFLMGSDRHYAEEAPAQRVSVAGFWIEGYAVTNAQFARFVAETGHVTVAERAPNAADYPGAKLEMLRPGSLVFGKTHARLDNPYAWWHYVFGADWRHPRGPNSSLGGLDQHPVVHVAFEDALAYATWAGRDLPTEAEWEFAARGGLEGAEFAWGDELMPDGQYMANTWQGTFPRENLLADGYEWTAPVGAYPPNGYGLFDMIGNVWEWTSDWYQERRQSGAGCCSAVDANHNARQRSYDPRLPEIRIPRKVIKGGSFLCAPNYCRRYRPAARRSQPIDTSACHLGFRCVLRPDAMTS